MPIVDPRLEQYIASLREPPDAVLEEMERRTQETGFPSVGPSVGRLLHILALASGCRRVLELGSGFGYSALWLARALPADGEVHCTDASPANREAAEGYFRRAGLGHLLHFHVGDALEVAASLEGPFDLVFNDIDKQGYPATVERAVALLRPGGLFVSDNTLWKGKVVETGPSDEKTGAVLRFNEAVARHPELCHIILPLRDGVTVALKR